MILFDVKVMLLFSDNLLSVELLIYKGMMGLDVIDICKLYGQIGKFMYDLGFMLMVLCNLVIMYIDGDKGELLYCGYLIDNFV